MRTAFALAMTAALALPVLGTTQPQPDYLQQAKDDLFKQQMTIVRAELQTQMNAFSASLAMRLDNQDKEIAKANSAVAALKGQYDADKQDRDGINAKLDEALAILKKQGTAVVPTVVDSWGRTITPSASTTTDPLMQPIMMMDASYSMSASGSSGTRFPVLHRVLSRIRHPLKGASGSCGAGG